VLQAVENPSDEVAVVAALRSPVLACSDAHLAEYRAAGGRWRYPVHDELDLPDDHPVLSGMRTLDDLHRRMPWLPVNELVDEIIRVGHLAEATAVRNRPRDHWRRYRLLLDEARSFVEAGGRSLGDFVAWIELQADERASRLETIVPEADDDAVRILTVHGAKGLEFPIVFLSGLNAPPMPRHPRVVWHD